MKRMTFGQLLEKYRLDNDLSFPQLAELTGKNTGHLSRIERGEIEPTKRIKNQISKKLGLDWVPEYEREIA